MTGISPTETLHARIREDILEKIVAGEWRPGHQLDKEIELADQYGVSRMTMNKVLTQLAQQGFIVRRKRSGTFVARSRTQSAVMEITDIAEEVAALGRSYKWELLSCETRQMRPGDLNMLGIERSTISERTLLLSGVHYADSEPFCLETRAINLNNTPTASHTDFSEQIPGSWLLRTKPWSTARHKLRAINVTGENARLLDLPEQTACLEILRKTEIGGDWVTHVRLLYPGEAHQLTAEFEPRNSVE